MPDQKKRSKRDIDVAGRKMSADLRRKAAPRLSDLIDKAGPADTLTDRVFAIAQGLLDRRKPRGRSGAEPDDLEAVVRDLLAEHRAALVQLSEELDSYLAIVSMGVDVRNVPLRRVFPIRIYVSRFDEKKVWRLWRRLKALLDEAGFDIAAEFPEQRGSWFKKFFVKSRNAVTSDEARDRLKQVERALRLPLDKQDAEIARTFAEGASSLLQATHDDDDVVVQLGPLLLLKRRRGAADGDSTVVALTLTPRQLAAIERNQEALMNPDELLSFLRGVEELPDSLPQA